MLFDLEELNEHEQTAHTDVCILGAGIAGLVLATQLADKGMEVTLMEAGGLNLEDRSQLLYDAEMTRSRHAGTFEGRFRTFGGSSTRWGGQLLSYPDDILHPVAGAPSRSWPIGGEEIEPYYAKVLGLFHVPNLPFDSRVLPMLGKRAVPLGEGISLRFSRWSPFGRRNLAQTLGRQVLTHPKIRLYVHSNVAELQGSNGHIASVRAMDYARRSFQFTAERFVVCCGTVESSRLLLLSPAVADPQGLIGRGFTDHVSVPVARVPDEAKAAVHERLGPFFGDGVLYTAKMEATSELQRDNGLLAVMAHFTIEEPGDSGIGAVRNLMTSLQRRDFRAALTKNLKPMLLGLSDVGRLAWNMKVHKRRVSSRRAVVRLNIDMEQDPDGANRVRLSDATDALGLRKAAVEWTVSNVERQTVRRFVPLIRERLLSAGFPALDWDDADATGEDIRLADTFHPMGGLRMGTDVRESVVDTDLRVHSTDNLYVASCAVFPSGGSSNPTFTMMALAMRLADHLGRTAV